jgi:hypothetical protein
LLDFLNAPLLLFCLKFFLVNDWLIFVRGFLIA